MSEMDLPRMSRPITVRLIPKASASLEAAMQASGHTSTDTINRAVQFYAWALQLFQDGDELLVRDSDGGLSRVRPESVDGGTL